MPTAAKSGFGTTLTRAANVIAELTKIGSPKLSLDTEEVTSHQSADGYKEFIGTLLDAGDLAIEGNYIPGDTLGQIGLVADMNAKTLQDFVLTFPTAVATTWTFKAYVTSFEIGEADTKGALTFKATLKISGKPVLGITLAGNLTGLVVTTGTLIPAFAAGTYDYVATIATGVASVTITPTCAAATSIEVNGNVVATGVPSSAIALGAAGSITAATVVVNETGKMPKTYSIKLARA
jgi:hypothetical protein